MCVFARACDRVVCVCLGAHVCMCVRAHVRTRISLHLCVRMYVAQDVCPTFWLG